MATSLPSTPADLAAWARLWELARDPWTRTEDLAEVLGVSRSAVAQWATGTREGPWSMLRGALRRTARRYPLDVPRMVATLARELFDAEGRWVSADVAEDLGSVPEELADVMVAAARLVEAGQRGADSEEIRRLAAALTSEAEEVGHAAMRVAS